MAFGPPVPSRGARRPHASLPPPSPTGAPGTQPGKSFQNGPPACSWPQCPTSALGKASSPSRWVGQRMGAAGPLQAPYCLQPNPFFLDRKG